MEDQRILFLFFSSDSWSFRLFFSVFVEFVPAGNGEHRSRSALAGTDTKQRLRRQAAQQTAKHMWIADARKVHDHRKDESLLVGHHELCD